MQQVGKIGPWASSGAVELGEFTTLNGDTWFWCDDGVTGREPWVISVTGVSASVSFYGAGCPGSGNQVPAAGAVGGLPRLDNAAFAMRVGNGLPLSFTSNYLSFGAADGTTGRVGAAASASGDVPRRVRARSFRTRRGSGEEVGGGIRGRSCCGACS